MHTFYEFFAGGGMARAGLGDGWACLLANDADPKKADCYTQNWGAERLKLADVATISAADLPDRADLAWASFPCQDLSLAGAGAGLKGERSGTFWPFWKLIDDLALEGRPPRLVALENVCGALTSHAGRDFASIGVALQQASYNFGALVMDAVDFVPQSRPRLFIIAVHNSLVVPPSVAALGPDPNWHKSALIEAYRRLPEACQKAWIWWRLPAPPMRRTRFAQLIEENPVGVEWHTAEQTRKLLDMMSPINRAKVDKAKAIARPMVGTIYRRTRQDLNSKVQRAEIRFDDVAGCLRTPAGGSSRQVIMLIEGESVRSRLLSARETARLMGLPDSYRLPPNYNEAYHLTGDGVAVPVVRYLAANLLEPLLSASNGSDREAA